VLQRDDFSRHWYHSEHLLVEGTTMSKSKGNYYTLGDLLAKGYSPMAVRYALLSGHPRKQLNFTLDSMHAAESALKTLRTVRAALPATGGSVDVFTPVVTALHDDLNTPGAFGALFSAINSSDPTDIDAAQFDRAMFALGLNLSAADAPKATAPAAITELAAKRWAAKQAKDFAAADALRKELAAAGWAMRDSKTDYKLEPLKK
jgi:cysteinyl-tRNA synthetase